MANLSADEVFNKKFQPTKFREGYDQDEVDDFLDEVVATLRAAADENEALKRQNSELTSELERAQARILELESAGPAAGAAATPKPAVAAAATTGAVVAPVAGAPTSGTSTAEPASTGGSQADSATVMLALAQRVHDEYVDNGKAEAARIVGEAQTSSERMVREAEDQRARTIGQLEEERTSLERKIDELRVFERDYRTRLKSYLESLLNDVEGRGPVAPPVPGSKSDTSGGSALS